jgi:hypothetical protein
MHKKPVSDLTGIRHKQYIDKNGLDLPEIRNGKRGQTHE